MIDVRRKVGAAVAAVSLCAMVGVGGLIGCAPQATPAPAAAESTAEESAGIASGNLDKWAEQFPLQYNSYHQSPVKADGYLQHIRGGNNGMGAKVVHNVPQFYDLAAKADVLCDEMIAALS